MTHQVAQEEQAGWRRWVCDGCDWATEWAAYTDPAAAAAAIRHQIAHTETSPALREQDRGEPNTTEHNPRSRTEHG